MLTCASILFVNKCAFLLWCCSLFEGRLDHLVFKQHGERLQNPRARVPCVALRPRARRLLLDGRWRGPARSVAVVDAANETRAHRAIFICSNDVVCGEGGERGEGRERERGMEMEIEKERRGRGGETENERERARERERESERKRWCIAV